MLSCLFFMELPKLMSPGFLTDAIKHCTPGFLTDTIRHCAVWLTSTSPCDTSQIAPPVPLVWKTEVSLPWQCVLTCTNEVWAQIALVLTRFCSSLILLMLLLLFHCCYESVKLSQEISSCKTWLETGIWKLWSESFGRALGGHTCTHVAFF